jgi:hypothetical protein
VPTFPIRRSRWSLPFLWPLSPGRPTASVEDGRLVVRMGLLGRADVPLERVAAAGTMDWPWWGGLGVRIGRGLVGFVAASGRVALVDLTAPTRVRAPLGWDATSLAIGVEDVDGFIAAVAAARRDAPWTASPGPSEG